MKTLAARAAGFPQGLAARVVGLSRAVTLSYEPGYVTVRIADSGGRRNGPGPSANGSAAAKPGPLLAGSGLGLAGIAERVASCGGNLTVGPTGPGGFAVTARLPSL